MGAAANMSQPELNHQTEPQNSPIIAIVGPTASGKSQLALQLAQQVNGNILCADATTVYKDLDIGSAKPSLTDRALVTHFGLDLVSPDAPFNAAKYKSYADQIIKEHDSTNRPLIMVGGSGLYVDSVLYDYSFADQPEEARSAEELYSLSLGQLRQLAVQLGDMPDNLDTNNPRRLVSFIRRGGRTASRQALRPNTLILGAVTPNNHEKLIEQRVESMIQAGLADEVQVLSQKYGWGAPAMQAIGYREFRDYFKGQIYLDDVARQIITHTRQLAKKQRTWLRRNSDITWLNTEKEAVELVTTLMNK